MESGVQLKSYADLQMFGKWEVGVRLKSDEDIREAEGNNRLTSGVNVNLNDVGASF